MLKEQMFAELQRLRSVTPKSKDANDQAAKEALRDELFRKFGHLPIDIWKRVVDQIIESWDKHYMPKVKHFSKAYHEVGKPAGGGDASPSMSLEDHHEWLEATARNLPPAGARHVLKALEDGKIPPFMDRIMSIVVERAGLDSELITEEWEAGE